MILRYYSATITTVMEQERTRTRERDELNHACDDFRRANPFNNNKS